MKYGSGRFFSYIFFCTENVQLQVIFISRLIPYKILYAMSICNAYLLSMDELAGMMYSSLLYDSWKKPRTVSMNTSIN